MVVKCNNCKYMAKTIEQFKKDRNKGKCKGCNDENNSKNWAYDLSLDDIII